MAVPLGKLLVQNYRVVGGQDGTEHCELAESSRYWMDPSNPGKVEPEEPIHSVANPAELNQRAVSIHVYSFPTMLARCTSSNTNALWKFLCITHRSMEFLNPKSDRINDEDGQDLQD